jgi:hypothetical protein
MHPIYTENTAPAYLVNTFGPFSDVVTARPKVKIVSVNLDIQSHGGPQIVLNQLEMEILGRMG